MSTLQEIVTSDVEMQSTTRADNEQHVNDIDLAILECLFQLPLDRFSRWYPGSRSFCRYLETCFTPLLFAEFATVWQILGKETPDSTRGCWQLFRDVHAAIRASSSESSIKDVVNKLVTTHAPPASPGRLEIRVSNDFAPFFVLVFSVLCWATMTLQPKLCLVDFSGSPSLVVHRRVLDRDTLQMDESVQRPIPALFNQFHRAMSRSRWRYPIGEAETDASEALEVACLNYSSLNHMANISLNWVSDLASHLDLDATKRRLSVYRFPTFCALSSISASEGHSVPLLARVQRQMCGFSGSELPEEEAGLHQEVLLSYRLIFGQTRGSRQLAKVALREERRRCPNEYDELLDIVCTRPYDSELRSLPASLWPVTCCSVQGRLQEQSSYSSHDDFPLFGQRLAKLQSFTRRQQPSQLRDLWRDRRNPLQWYTFWAVLIVGGISIVLGSLQLAVAIAQLAVSIPPSR